MKRFYGDPIVGAWIVPNKPGDFFPRQLREREAEFDWKPKDDKAECLWPFDRESRLPLTYDEYA